MKLSSLCQDAHGYLIPTTIMGSTKYSDFPVQLTSIIHVRSVVLLTMDFLKRNNCPLCRSEDIFLFKKGTFDPADLGVENFKITDSRYGSLWTFYRCKSCGFVFFNPYIPSGDIVEFYSQLEDKEYSAEAEGRAKNFKTILHRLETLNPGKTLLDIGAASGIFLDLADRCGYRIEGIEPSAFLVQEAARLFGLKLHNGTVEEFNPGKRYAVVTLLDIIEHLVDPDAFMDSVDNLIEDNGLLVIVTPDVDSLAARLMGKRWWHYRIAHINFFNLKALRRLLDKHNFEIVKKKKYVWNFSLFYLLTRIFPALKGKKALQKTLKRLHLKLPLFDSWEIYARKRQC
jgi:2-polyprenyl-3-methyl-5-hydroxy-6-metoxy-1,4-benzoquinol methylase